MPKPFVLPPGILVFTPGDPTWQNIVVSVSGGPKTGKTSFAVKTQAPRYIVFLDAHDNLQKLLEEANEAFPGPTYIKKIRPVPYKKLTQEMAQGFLDEIDEFAAWARDNSRKEVAEGRTGGTFILDGARTLKGYAEKAILGISTTLGWRPSKGGKSVSTFEYAESNAWVSDFIKGFLDAPLDVVLTWEGAAKYVNGQYTGTYRSGEATGTPYVANVGLMTLMDREPIIVANEIKGYKAVPKLEIVYSDFGGHMNGRVVKTQTLDSLRELFGLEAAEQEALMDPDDAEHKPAAADPFAQDEGPDD